MEKRICVLMSACLLLIGSFCMAADVESSVLLTGLEYPRGLWAKGNTVYLTETAGRNTGYGGKICLDTYDISTGQKTTVLNNPENSDAVVAASDDKIYLTSYHGTIPGENGKVSSVDSQTFLETHLIDLAIAARDMFIDEQDNIYIIGSSDLGNAQSLYLLPAGDYLNPVVLQTGLGRTWCISKHDGYVYFSDLNAIKRFPEQGGQVETFLNKDVMSITFGGGFLYYADYFDNTVGRVALTTKQDEILISGLNKPTAIRYHQQTGKLYFLEVGTSAGSYKDGRLQVIEFGETEDIVWVLHNEDSDYSTPPFDDTLSLVDSSGQITTQWAGFNIAQTVGGNRAIAVSPLDQTVVVCENVNGPISKRDTQGNVLFTVNEGPAVVDVLADGTIYALTGVGSINGDRILKISAEGDVLDSRVFGGFDLKADEVSGGVYIVGGDLKYCTLDLVPQWSTDPIGWVAVSVDTGADGTAWIVERQYLSSSSSHNRLLHVSSTGAILHALDLPYPPSCVRVDKENGSVYVVGDQLYKYNQQAVLQSNFGLGGQQGFTLSVGSQGVWVGTYADLRLISFDGTTLITNNNFPRSDQKYVACLVSTGGYNCQAPIPYDTNDDCKIDLGDLAAWAGYWGECNRVPQDTCW